jgi:hypothetical protein
MKAFMLAPLKRLLLSILYARIEGRYRTLGVLLGVLWFASAAHAQVSPIPFIKPTWSNNSGQPCSGCQLFTYQAGTTTPLVTYSDSAGTIPNANPVILDATGRANVFLGSSAYKFVLESSGGITYWTEDNITATSLSLLASANVWTNTNTFQATTNFNGPVNMNVGFTSTGPNTLGGGGSISGTWTGSPILTGVWNFQGELDAVNIVMSGQLFATNATMPPFVIASNMEVANLNANLLEGCDWASPCQIGGTTPNIATFTDVVTPEIVLGGIGPITGVVGLDTKFVTGVPLTGSIGATVCKDSNGGITTTGCAGGFTQVETASAVGCTTQGTSFSNCDVVLTWPNAFADTGYIPVCSVKDTNLQASGGDGSTGDVPNAPIRSFTASTVTVALTTLAGRAISGAANATIYCHGIHP